MDFKSASISSGLVLVADNPIALKDYAIGDKWHDSRAILEQTAYNIISKLNDDTLPGLDAAKVTAIKDTLSNYKNFQRPIKLADKPTPPAPARPWKPPLKASLPAAGKFNLPPTLNGPPATRPTPASAANSDSRPTKR